MKKEELGSNTAKNGFKNEHFILDKFNNWKNDNQALDWLTKMQYNINEIQDVKAVKIKGSFKSDIQVQIKIVITLKETIDVQNISVKLVSNANGYNQIDKRWLSKYQELWNMPLNIYNILQRYTGETLPDIQNPKDSRRMFANEFSLEEQSAVLKFLNENKVLIISDLLKGRGEFSAEWFLVVLNEESCLSYSLESINFVMNFFGNGEIIITEKGNFRIGKITMQRKGGDAGRKTAQMLQFKINPALLISRN
jgi:hypothetical protein